MLMLKPRRTYRVPNRLAFLAAGALAVTVMVGFPERDEASQDLKAKVEANQQGEHPAVNDDSVARNGKLNISKLLFGHG